MTGAEVTHWLFYGILAMSGIGLITAFGAMFMLGRSNSYKKD